MSELLLLTLVFAIVYIKRGPDAAFLGFASASVLLVLTASTVNDALSATMLKFFEAWGSTAVFFGLALFLLWDARLPRTVFDRRGQRVKGNAPSLWGAVLLVGWTTLSAGFEAYNLWRQTVEAHGNTPSNVGILGGGFVIALTTIVLIKGGACDVKARNAVRITLAVAAISLALAVRALYVALSIT